MSIHGPGGMPGTAAANHSRAAIVCFGGWGLQTMLHVWPRLGLIQAERQALETAASLPDLDRLTAFAAIVPGAHAAAGEQVRLEVQAVRPAPDHRPPPGYLEGLLDAFQKWPAGAAAQGLTESELQGSRLLRCAQEAGVVQSLALVPMSSGASLTGPVLPARSAMCSLGLDLAPAIAGALVREVIDATRLDGVQPYDPFVQTTIYVVASLAEAHATALMWPVLAELVATLGARHITRVVGFFDAGSFAGGASRAIEEAAVHVALQELETLIRPARPGAGGEALRQLVGVGHRPDADRPGADRPPVPGPLLDTVYLVDREKSNQALAQSPQELAVLVGNALEAFLVAGGAGLVEERLAAEVVGGRAFPYCALGTACDYVPLAEYIAAAIVGEQQQLICSEVLAATEKAGEDGTTLADLGAAQADALACTMDAGAALAFDRRAAAGVAAGVPAGLAEPGAAGWPAWLAGLRVAEDFLLPGAAARQLRQAQTAALWRKIAEGRLAEATTELDGVCDAAEMAWGLSGTRPGRQDSPSGGTGGEQGGPAGDGLAPRAAAAAVARLVEDICGASPGLMWARARAARWTAQIESVIEDLARVKMPTESAGGQQGRMALWRREWDALGTGGVSAPGASAAGGALGLVVAAILAGWLVSRSTAPISPLQLVAAVLAALALALVSARAAWTIATWRVRRLKRDWILLARELLAQHARRRLHRSLVRLYEQLQADLAALQASIEEAIAELAAWVEAGDGVSGRLPSPAGSAHLRLAHGSDRLWQTVREQITQATAQGESGRGATEGGAFGRRWLVQGQAPLHGQPREHGPSAQVQAILWAQIDRAKIGATRAPDPDRPAGGSALAALYRDYAALATRHLGCPEALLAGHAGLVRQVAREYDIERTLFGETEAPASDAGDHLPLAFLEQSYTRARPAANYEVISRLSRDGGDVDFGVTPEGGNSRLGNPARQRGIPLLASRDPLSVIFVRIVGGLALEDLTLAGRCRRAYQSISQADRDGLSLVPAAQTAEAASLYGTATGQP